MTLVPTQLHTTGLFLASRFGHAERGVVMSQLVPVNPNACTVLQRILPNWV